MEKEFIRKEIQYIDEGIFFNGEIKKLLVEWLEIVKDLESKGWKDIEWKWVQDYDSACIELHGKRLENDKEFEERKKSEEVKLKKQQQK